MRLLLKALKKSYEPPTLELFFLHTFYIIYIYFYLNQKKSDNFVTNCLFLPVSFLLCHMFIQSKIRLCYTETERKKKKEEQGCVKLSGSDSRKITSAEHQHTEDKKKKTE